MAEVYDDRHVWTELMTFVDFMILAVSAVTFATMSGGISKTLRLKESIHTHLLEQRDAVERVAAVEARTKAQIESYQTDIDKLAQARRALSQELAAQRSMTARAIQSVNKQKQAPKQAVAAPDETEIVEAEIVEAPEPTAYEVLLKAWDPVEGSPLHWSFTQSDAEIEAAIEIESDETP